MPRQSSVSDYERAWICGRPELQSHASLEIGSTCLGFNRVLRGDTSHQPLEGVGGSNLWSDFRSDRWSWFVCKNLVLNPKSHFDLWCGMAGGGGRTISSELAPADRTHCHSGIFFSYAKIFGPFGTSYQRASSNLDITPLGRQQNHNELSVLQAFGRIGKLVARTLFMMRLVFEALFFRPAHLVQ
jgi:hypothetical protein